MTISSFCEGGLWHRRSDMLVMHKMHKEKFLVSEFCSTYAPFSGELMLLIQNDF